jgi:hypothetical protein
MIEMERGRDCLVVGLEHPVAKKGKRRGEHIRGLKSGHVLLVSSQTGSFPELRALNEGTVQKTCNTKQKFPRSLSVCPQISISVFTLR